MRKLSGKPSKALLFICVSNQNTSATACFLCKKFKVKFNDFGYFVRVAARVSRFRDAEIKINFT